MKCATLSDTALPAALSAGHDLLQVLLDSSLTGLILFQLVLSPDAPVVLTDLAYGYLNPVTQQVLRLAENARDVITIYSQPGVGTLFREVRPA